MKLFDTTFLIDLVDGDKGAKALAERVDNEHGFSAVSVVTVQEYLRGVYFLFSNSKAIRTKLEKTESELRHFEVISYNYDIAKVAASLDAELASKGVVIGMADIIISATALHLGLTLVTRNRKHFERIPKIRI